MTLTITLTHEEEVKLQKKAAARGLDPVGYVRQLIDVDISPPAAAPSEENILSSKTIGRQLLDEWEEEGVLGLFADRPDSPQFARELCHPISNRTT